MKNDFRNYFCLFVMFYMSVKFRKKGYCSVVYMFAGVMCNMHNPRINKVNNFGVLYV